MKSLTPHLCRGFRSGPSTVTRAILGLRFWWADREGWPARWAWPGWRRPLGLDVLVGWLYPHLPKPMVVDADGLNALAAHRDVLARPGGPRILTPHPGEVARLLGGDRGPPEQREAAAAAPAARLGVVIVLKGHRTCITDGGKPALNTTGNPGMATGGPGGVPARP